MPPSSRIPSARTARGRLSWTLSLVLALLVGASGAVALDVVRPQRAEAAALPCVPGVVYAITNVGFIKSVNTTTGTVANLNSTDSTTANGLGVTTGGQRAVYADGTGATGQGTRPDILVWNAGGNGATTIYQGATLLHSITNVVRGGIDRTNNIYYYGGARSNDATTNDFYAFDLDTNASIGYVGSIFGIDGSNGDLAFDKAGNMLVVEANGTTNNVLLRVPNVPQTAQPDGRALSAAKLADLPSTPVNGITFDGNGFLYTSNTTTLYQIDPNSGALVTQVNFSQSGTVDLADCENPGSLQVNGTFDREDANDQLNLAITGNGIASGNTGATTGTGTTATAGPVIGVPSRTYRVTETISNGSLSDYTTTLSCVDTNTGNAVSSTPVSGTPGAWDVVFPTREASGGDLGNVVCTTAVTAQRPAVTLVTAASRASTGTLDQSTTYTYTATNSGNTALSGVTISDPKAGLSTLGCTPAQPATLAVGGTLICTATRATSQADLDAGVAITNTGSVTADPPTGPAVTDTDGASVAVVQNRSVDLVQTAAPDPFTAAGQQLTYTFTATNDGNVTLTGTAIAPTKSGLSALTCTPSQPRTLAPGGQIVCTGTYTTTRADVDAGRTLSPATVAGTAPQGQSVTDSAPLTVPGPARAPDITLVKTTGPGAFTATGQRLTYTYVATNTGNVTLNGVTVTDPQADLSTLTCDTATPATLAPDAELTCTATYDTRQRDLDAGGVNTTATATGSAPTGVTPATVTATDDAPVTGPTRSPALTVVKDVDPGSVAVAGAEVTYTYTVTNAGNVTLTDVGLTDPQDDLGDLECTPTQPRTLAPDASFTCTATYALTQADLDAGGVNTTATATGRPPSGDEVSDADDAPVTVAGAPSISLAKSATPTSVSTLGETVTYSYLVTNTGNLTLRGVTVLDGQPNLVGLDCGPAVLAPEDTLTCSATYQVRQGDLDAGTIDADASAAGTASNDQLVTDVDDAPVTAVATADLALVKTADPTSGNRAGDTVTYTYTATNTGNVTLAAVDVVDPQARLSALTCDPAQPITLAPDDALTCTATYVLTQDDVDAGGVNSVAVSTGQAPAGGTVEDRDDAPVLVPADASVSLVKTATPTAVARSGDVVTYTYLATNTGNVTLGGVRISDPQDGLPTLSCDPAAPAVLAPDATLTCTVGYPLTQADVDAGGVDTTATVTGTPPAGADVSDTDDAPVTVAGLPAVGVTATADRTEVSAPGQVVTWTFVATNNGNVTLDDVVVGTDLDGLVLVCDPAQPATLAPRGTLTCTATSEVTQADVDGPGPSLTATATGTPPRGPAVTDDAEAAVPSVRTPAVTLAVSPDPASVTEAGTVVTFTYVATNTGNVTLTGVEVADAREGLSALDCGPAAAVPPQGTVTCTATYTVTQADVDAGGLTTTGTVTGTPPVGDDVEASAEATVTAAAAPLLTVEKSAVPERVTRAGDVVTYTVLVRNAGNVTVGGVTVDDPRVELTCDPVLPAALAPAAEVTCTGDYTATQDDVDDGGFTNTVAVLGTGPRGVPVTAGDSVEVETPAAPSVTLVKDADPTQGRRAGDEVVYTYTATNTGNVSLLDVQVSDPQEGLDDLDCDPPLGSTLAPSATMTCTVTYVLTQADVDAGQVNTTATVVGTERNRPTDLPPVTASDDAPVTVGAGPAIDLEKSVQAEGDSAGDVWTYTLTATNTGNVTLAGVTVSDELEGLGALSCTPSQGASLAPDEALTCTAEYALTQADVDAGGVSNTATVTGSGPGDLAVEDSDVLETGLDQRAEVEFDKVADLTTVAVGDVVTYTMTARNTGTVTLPDVQVVDTMAGLSALDCAPAAPAALAPGETLRCTATYTVTAADAAAGSLVNTASVTAGGLLTDEPGAVAGVELDVTPPPTPSDPAPAPDDDLADTGGAPVGVLLVGLLLVGVGGLALVRARRRGPVDQG